MGNVALASAACFALSFMAGCGNSQSGQSVTSTGGSVNGGSAGTSAGDGSAGGAGVSAGGAGVSAGGAGASVGGAGASAGGAGASAGGGAGVNGRCVVHTDCALGLVCVAHDQSCELGGSCQRPSAECSANFCGYQQCQMNGNVNCACFDCKSAFCFDSATASCFRCVNPPSLGSPAP